MSHMLTHAGRWALLRAPLLALVVLAAACDSADNLATTEPTTDQILTEPTLVSDSLGLDDAAVALTSTDLMEIEASEAAVRRRGGVPFGPFGLWQTPTSLAPGSSSFTASHTYTDAGSIITLIKTARSKNHRLVLAMTGGPSSRYKTRGKFDFTKWKNKMNTFKTAAIKRAVAQGVADGTIVGNALIDEPETRQWGGVVTKRRLDQMASYAKSIFPTLPMGVNHGPPAHRWRASERYRVVDYVVHQYAWWVTSGNVTAWRDQVLAQARRDGVTPAFSLNILNGGKQDRSGWDCKGTGGRGTRAPNCRMTAEQVRSWAAALGPKGCAMIMWKYDRAFMSRSANVTAMRNAASALSGAAGRSCRRSRG
jgi:hypothetical protein